MPLNPEDIYIWEAVFADGSRLREDDTALCRRHPNFPDGHDGEHAFACIDHPDLKAFALLPIPRSGWFPIWPKRPTVQRIVIDIPSGGRLTFARRRGTHFNMTTGEVVKSTVTVAGFTKGREKSILTILEDGSVMVGDDFDAYGPSAPAAWDKQGGNV